MKTMSQLIEELKIAETIKDFKKMKQELFWDMYTYGITCETFNVLFSNARRMLNNNISTKDIIDEIAMQINKPMPIIKAIRLVSLAYCYNGIMNGK